MRSALRATIVLSSSSLVSVFVGLLSAKALALLVGPAGTGYMGLLQGLVGLVGLAAGLGIGTGLISMGANALAHGEGARVAALERAAWWLLAGAGGVAVALMALWRTPISRWMLGGPEHADSVVWMGLTLVLTLAASLQTSILNAHHRVGDLARVGVLNSVLGGVLTVALVWLWRERGIAPAVIASSAVSLAVSTWVRRRGALAPRERPAGREVRAAAGALLRFGAPYALSQALGTGVQFALPALVLNHLGLESVGHYRAALSLSSMCLGFLLLAMGSDYYARVSAVSEDAARLVGLVNQQHRLIMLLAAPMILMVLALGPYLVPLVYSAEFAPAVGVLEWQLVGDLFKFASWTMGFVLLARRYSVTLLLVELLAGANTLGLSWLGLRWFGLPGVGLAYLGTYVVHYLVVWRIVRRHTGLAWTRGNVLLLAMATLGALLVPLSRDMGLGGLRTPAALAVGLAAVVWSGLVLAREAGAPAYVRALLRRVRPAHG